MVQSTGPANAQYLHSLVVGAQQNKNSRQESREMVGQKRWLGNSSWSAAAQFALAVTLSSSQNDLQNLDIEDRNNILVKTKDAVITLQGVLEGKHDKDIDETLDDFQVPRDRWWSALYRIVEGNIVIIIHWDHYHTHLHSSTFFYLIRNCWFGFRSSCNGQAFSK